MEHPLADRPPRWGLDAHPHAHLEASASVFGGLSALRDAAFGQDDRSPPHAQAPTLPPPASFHHSSASSLPPSPLYYSRDSSPASSASASRVDPPFYFAPFPTLPPTRLSPPDDRRGLSPSAFDAKQLPGARRASAPLPSRPTTPPTPARSAATGPKRVSDEERKAKHREAQRRFVRRKKVAMQQLRELAATLEKQFELLQATSESQRLEAENTALHGQLAAEVKAASFAEADPAIDDVERREDKSEVAKHPGWEYREFEW